MGVSKDLLTDLDKVEAELFAAIHRLNDLYKGPLIENQHEIEKLAAKKKRLERRLKQIREQVSQDHKSEPARTSPLLSSSQATQDRETSTSDITVLSNELATSHHIIMKLRRKSRGRPDREILRGLADRCRHKNGSINFSKLGKELGVANHTAKKWCIEDKIT